MRFKHRIEIQRNNPTQDSTGQEVASWETVRKCWADVRDLMTGGESNRLDRIEAVAESEVEILYPHGDEIPIAEDRIIFVEGGVWQRTLNVIHVRRKDGDRRRLILECREKQDG